MSEERKNLVRSLGAKIRLVSREENAFLGSIRLAEEWAGRNPHAFLPRQFSKQNNIEAHFQTTLCRPARDGRRLHHREPALLSPGPPRIFQNALSVSGCLEPDG